MFQVAYIFPGQGAQYVGIGRDLYENFPRAREVFQTANEVLGFDLSSLCFQGPEAELHQTLNNQPAMLTVSIACLRALEDQARDLLPTTAAGLSLGEYSALVAAEAIKFEDALRLVRRRAEFMEEASQSNPGKMAAIIGLSTEEVEELCRAADTEVANLNCPGQVVISGKLAAMDRAMELARSKGAKKVLCLDVNGPFHSSLMDSAAEKLRKELKEVRISQPKIPIVANVTANYESLPEEIKENLVNQVNHSVGWEDSIRLIAKDGITGFLEIGPGKVIKGLIRHIDPDLRVYNIWDTKSLSDLKESVCR